MKDKSESMAWATPERLQYELVNHPDYSSYQEWKRKYPLVLEKFKELSMLCVAEKKHFGMWLIANRLRWDYFFEYNTDFKISNDYTALITREIALECPELLSFCRIKRLSWADGFENIPTQTELFA